MSPPQKKTQTYGSNSVKLCTVFKILSLADFLENLRQNKRQSEGLPTVSSTWRSMVLCAGVLSDSLTLATCPNSEYDIATSIERYDHLCQLYDYADCIRLLLIRVSY